MKKIFLFLFISGILSSCLPMYVSQLEQVERGMTELQITTLMGGKYTIQETDNRRVLEYKARFNNTWTFEFKDDKLVSWYRK
jgi:hypothetical protein